jgi:putative alpha-1,2-mannosidase
MSHCLAVSSLQIAASRVGHLRFTFNHTQPPYILLESSRPTVITSTPSNITLPSGSIAIDPQTREITGSNSERQDWIIGPTSTPAKGFNGYFCARFDRPFVGWGIVQNGTVHRHQTSGNGVRLSGFARFELGVEKELTVNVRIGVSFISIEQARWNLDNEIGDGVTLEETARRTRAEWAEKLDRVKIEGATEVEKDIFYTGFYHTLQVSSVWVLCCKRSAHWLFFTTVSIRAERKQEVLFWLRR